MWQSHDLFWAAAEQTAVDYGVRLANTAPGVDKPSNRELRWIQFTRIYRMIMQYRRTILWLVRTYVFRSLPLHHTGLQVECLYL